jgi:hypothetical protein
LKKKNIVCSSQYKNIKSVAMNIVNVISILVLEWVLLSGHLHNETSGTFYQFHTHFPVANRLFIYKPVLLQ